MISIKRLLPLIIIPVFLVTVVAGCEKKLDKDHDAKEAAASKQARKGTFQPSSGTTY